MSTSTSVTHGRIRQLHIGWISGWICLAQCRKLQMMFSVLTCSQVQMISWQSSSTDIIQHSSNFYISVLSVIQLQDAQNIYTVHKGTGVSKARKTDQPTCVLYCDLTYEQLNYWHSKSMLISCPGRGRGVKKKPEGTLQIYRDIGIHRLPSLGTAFMIQAFKSSSSFWFVECPTPS